MSHALAASRTIPMPEVDAGRLVSVAMASVITLGLVLLLATAATAQDCIGTVLTSADVTLPTLIG